MRNVMLAFGVGLAVMAAGCASYQDFARAEARSDDVRAALAAQRASIAPDDPDREDRVRYLVEMQLLVTKVNLMRIMAGADPMTGSRARETEQTLVMIYDYLEMLAATPGRVGPDGEPSETGMAELAALVDSVLPGG